MEQSKNANSYLETESLGKLMLKYSIPCIASLLVAALYNIVDQIFIANADYLGSYGNAANSVVFPLTVVALSLATMIGDGCCAFVSISLGANKKDTASQSTGTSITLSLIIGVLLMVIYLLFSDTIITMFGGSVNEMTFAYAKEYFFWISLGIPFYTFGQAMSPIIRSDGSPQFAMVTLVLGAIINIILDPIFIYPLQLGMKGAALATIAGQIVAGLLSFYYCFHMKAVTITKDCLKIRFSLLKKILPLGMSSFLSQISVVFSMAAVNNMARIYGAMDPIFGLEEYAQIPTAVVGIVMKFFQILVSLSVGLCAGCIPIIGYNVGAGRNDRVKELLKKILISEAIIGLIATAIFEFFPNQLINIFGAENESIYYTQFAVKTIRLFLCMSTLACLNKATFIFLQAVGKARQASLLSLLREIVLGVGLAILLPMIFGLDGLLYFMACADIITFIVAIFVLKRTFADIDRGFMGVDNPTPEATEEEAYVINPLANVVITVGRTYGAGGRTIAKALAKELQIPCYDTSLLKKVAQKTGLSENYLRNIDEKSMAASVLYGSYATDESVLTTPQSAAKAQAQIIEAAANEGPCIIIGRCADTILKSIEDERPEIKEKAQGRPLITLFITAGLDTRTKKIMERDHLSEAEAKRKIKDVDKERADHYRQLSDDKWGYAGTYDLCIDTDKVGIDGAVSIILEYIKKAVA